MVELVYSVLTILGIACGLVIVLCAALSLLVIPALEGLTLLLEIFAMLCPKVEQWRGRCGSR